MITMMRNYVRFIDAINHKIGRIVMYGIFVLMAILVWSSVSKTFFLPSLWTLEMAQFVMVAYYILGGPYSIQMGAHVRMDLFYGSWKPRTKMWVDCFTVLFLIFYLAVILYSGIDSTSYSLLYGERSPTAWRPYIWPIKIIICFGLVMMLLQCVSELCKDVLRLYEGGKIDVL